MMSKILTTKELRLRLQAARLAERTVPDQVRRAYGEALRQGENPPHDDKLLAEGRARAQNSLVDKGLLTREELDTLAVDEAISAARQRLRDEIAALQAEQARDAATPDSSVRPPRTLRR
jgi:hypothetical protein